MEIKNFSLTQLNNGDFYQFNENVVNVAKLEPAVASILLPFANQIPIMQNSFIKEQLTQETIQVVALDKLRDRAFMKIKYIIDAFLLDDRTPSNITAAEKVETIIKNYGGGKMVSFDYNKETAFITNFILDTKNVALSQITALNLVPDIDYLETCNNKFKDFYGTRNDLQSQLSNTPPFYKLRKTIATNYKNFIADVMSLHRNNATITPQIEALISRINIEVDKFKLLIPTTVNNNPTPPMV